MNVKVLKPIIYKGKQYKVGDVLDVPETVFEAYNRIESTLQSLEITNKEVELQPITNKEIKKSKKNKI